MRDSNGFFSKTWKLILQEGAALIDFFSVQASSAHPSFVLVIYSQILAFILSSLLAWAYDKTFKGLS